MTYENPIVFISQAFTTKIENLIIFFLIQIHYNKFINHFAIRSKLKNILKLIKNFYYNMV